MTENKKSDEKRETAILVRLTNSEKEKIHEFAESLHISDASFCRTAIFEKIRRLNSPELYTNLNPGMDQESIGLIKEGLSLSKDIKRLDEKLDTLVNLFAEKAEGSLSLEELNKEIETIRKIVAEYKGPMPLSKIIKRSSIDKAKVIYILQRSFLFRAKNRGWVLNE